MTDKQIQKSSTEIAPKMPLYQDVAARTKTGRGILGVINEADKLHDRISDAEMRAEVAERASRHDPMTKLLNRRGLRENFSSWLEGSIVELGKNRPEVFFVPYVAVTYLDVDDFNDINAKYGHAMGDIALQVIGYCMMRERPDSLNVRLGGDENVTVSLLDAPVEASDYTELYRSSILDSFQKNEQTGSVPKDFIEEIVKKFRLKTDTATLGHMLEELSISVGTQVMSVTELEEVGSLWKLIEKADRELENDKKGKYKRRAITRRAPRRHYDI